MGPKRASASQISLAMRRRSFRWGNFRLSEASFGRRKLRLAVGSFVWLSEASFGCRKLRLAVGSFVWASDEQKPSVNTLARRSEPHIASTFEQNTRTHLVPGTAPTIPEEQGQVGAAPGLSALTSAFVEETSAGFVPGTTLAILEEHAQAGAAPGVSALTSAFEKETSAGFVPHTATTG